MDFPEPDRPMMQQTRPGSILVGLKRVMLYSIGTWWSSFFDRGMDV